MSKQSEAKQSQGYRTEQRNCGNCMHRSCEKVLPPWMERSNANGVGSNITFFTVERHGLEQRQRCGLGGFAIRKTATCDRWVLVEQA